MANNEDSVFADARERFGEAARKLPNMNEFSPGTLDTNEVLHVITWLASHQNDTGDTAGMVDVLERIPKIAATINPIERKKRAKNVLIGMSQCGLLDKSGGTILPKLSQLAIMLQGMSTKDASSAFSKHLLTEAHGLDLLDAASMIRARGDSVTVQRLRDELRARGFVVTENEGNASKIRLWLEASGVVDSDWKVCETTLLLLVGATSSTLDDWSGLNREQRIFAKTVKSLDCSEAEGQPISVRHVKSLAEATHGRTVFPEGKLREKVIDPLVRCGLLTATGKGSGRGGDSGEIQVTEKLRGISIELPIDGMSGIPGDLRSKLATPLPKIFSDLKSPDKNVKGLALELLALRLVRDIGLFPVWFRERSNQTHEAEVDLVAQGVHLHYSRWLIQCKNTASVEVADIAKEVGMAVVLKAHVILMVTTGRFRRTVQAYANGLAEASTLQAVLIDGATLKNYEKHGPSAVIDDLHRNAHHVLALKQGQISEQRGP